MVVRSAFVAAYAEKAPDRTARLWAGHPSVIFSSGLGAVGAAAAEGRPVDRSTTQRIMTATARSPLSPEPFLVRGVEAQLAGDRALAERAFLEARRRDPRSVAARYFLADHYLKTGDTRQGLAEISALARLVPQSLRNVTPYLAAFARSQGGATHVKAMLRDHPELEPVLLRALAAEPDDADLIFSLWSGRGGVRARDWQQRLVRNLVTDGQYAKALAAWARFTAKPAQTGVLRDPEFASTDTPPPFGWTLASGAAGVAEPEAQGRLHILYYGRDNLVLAGQTLMLQPGRYRLSMRIHGAAVAAEPLSWRVRCLPSSGQIAEISLAATGQGGALTMPFQVPSSGCAAQQLELVGTAPEIPEQTDLTIGGLGLTEEGGR
jgi:tetratricopeptide (TPR) repeat protein